MFQLVWVTLVSILLLLGTGLRADDESTRDLSDGAPPSPEELARLFSILDSAEFDFLRQPAEASGPSERPFLPQELPENAPDWVRELVENLKSGRPSTPPSTGPPSSASPRGQDPGSPKPRSPKRPPMHPGPEGGAPKEGTPRPSAPKREPGRSLGADPGTEPEPQSARPFSSRDNRPKSRPRIKEEPSVSSRVTSSEPKSRPKSRKEFGDQFNKILMEAVARAKTEGDGEAENGLFGGSSSRVLSSVVERIQKLARENRDLTRNMRFQPTRQKKSKPSWVRENLASLNEQFKLPPKPNSNDFSEVAGQTGRVALATFGLIAVLLACGGIYHWRTNVAERAGRQRPRFVPRAIINEADLIRAVDDYLYSEFGSSSAWWHGGVIGRELGQRHLGLIREVLHLIRAYQRARYGGPQRHLSSEQLHRCEACLAQLAEQQRRSGDGSSASEAPA